uniref:Peptidase metallopeptidase domain-containing protein n=1 Tax=Leptobrachium leishanense TaxID=445787 RepID=A0A8C5Q962_9ANUR
MTRLLLLLLLSAACCSMMPDASQPQGGQDDAEYEEGYLKKHNNLETSVSQQPMEKSSTLITEKIHQMQKSFGLQVKENLGAATSETTSRPQCGVPDVGDYTFFQNRPKWNKQDLTYRIINYNRYLTFEEVDIAIQKACKVWSDVTPLTFTRVFNDVADIDILFARGAHNDFQPFDGPGKYLAHAFPPRNDIISGDIHFDDDEMWTSGNNGVNLFLVAAHELGHSLGLHHSDYVHALMHSQYKFIEPDEFQLSQDDIDGIQVLYGARKKKDTCRNVKFDAATTFRGETFFFEGEYFWRHIPQNTKVQRVLIRAFWPSLPSNIQAAYEYQRKDQVLLFRGKTYWILSGAKVSKDSPKSIYKLGFSKSVKMIDAAVHIVATKKTYFFVGSQYWSYDELEQRMDTDSPKQTSEDFPGIRKKVHAAFESNGLLYLFSGNRQYAFSPKMKRVTSLLEYSSWINC